MTKTRAVIFLNGQFHLPAKTIRSSDFLIGVDGGTKHITKLGLRPDIIIGDLDSLPHPSAGVPIIKYPTDKDKTDSELALEYALNQGFKDILAIGFVGKRFDHVVANLMMFARLTNKASISIISDSQRIYFVSSKLTFFGKKGQVVSLIPLFGNCVVTTTGLRWKLKKESLKLGSSRGVSNVMTVEKAKITVSQGLLLVVLTV